MALTVLTVVFAVTIAFIKYLYDELQTYQRFNDKASIDKAEDKADISYKNIFKTIKNSSWCMFTLFGILTLVHIILQPKSLVFLLIGFIVVALIFGGALYMGKDKLKKVMDFIEKTEKGASSSFQFVYLLFLFLMIGISISMLSINSDEMDRSLVEVFDDNQNSFLEGNSKYYFNKSKVLNRTSLELNDFILEGKNTVEIIILSEESSGKKTVRMVTDIYRNEKEITVSEKHFLVTP